MKNGPTPFTDTDYKELAASKIVQEALDSSNAAEVEAYLRDWYCAKFEDYITDGPGYVGAVWIVLTGVLNTIIITRTDSEFEIQNNY